MMVPGLTISLWSNEGWAYSFAHIPLQQTVGFLTKLAASLPHQGRQTSICGINSQYYTKLGSSGFLLIACLQIKDVRWQTRGLWCGREKNCFFFSVLAKSFVSHCSSLCISLLFSHLIRLFVHLPTTDFTFTFACWLFFPLSLLFFFSVILFIIPWLLHEHTSAFQGINIWCRRLAAYKKGECSLVRRDYSGQLRATKKKAFFKLFWQNHIYNKVAQIQRNINVPTAK